jgi:purine nucleosidase
MRGGEQWCREGDYRGWVACDPLAVAAALDERVVLDSQKVYCQVEYEGSHTRGMAVFDFEGKLGRTPNVRLVKRLDMERLAELMDLCTGA